MCKYIILNRPRPTYSCDACWASLGLCFLLWWLAHAHVVVCFHSLFGAGLVGQTCGLALDLSACLEFKNCGLNLLRGGLGLLLWLSGTSPWSVISFFGQMLFRNKFRPIKFNASFIALGLISFARANVICEHFLTGAANDNRQFFFHASNRSKYSKDRFFGHLS